MNKFVNGISALGCGAAIALLVSELSKEENITKIKARLNDIFGAKNADDVEYVDDNVNIDIMTRTMDEAKVGEVSVDDDLMKSCDMMSIECKDSDFARFLSKHIQIAIDTTGYITISDILDLGWLSDDALCNIASKYTCDERALMGWSNKCNHSYKVLLFYN